MADRFFTDGPPVWDFDELFSVAASAPVAVTALTVYLKGMHICNNDPLNPIVLTLTDTAGNSIEPGRTIAPLGTYQPPAFDLMPCGGIKAGADRAGLTARMWGWLGV